MSRTLKFIELFNKVSHHLQNRTGESTKTPFYELIDLASSQDPVIQKHSKTLKDFGKLRNAIVHDRGYPREVVAEISEQALSRFERLVEYILKPPLVYPLFKRDVRAFSAGDSLQSALTYLKEKDFSQAIVRLDGENLGIITSEGIAVWLTNQIDEDIISISETTLENILQHEIPNSFSIIHPNQTIEHARQAFEKHLEKQQARLYCLIITHDGSSRGKPQGIITPWDLLDQLK